MSETKPKTISVIIPVYQVGIEFFNNIKILKSELEKNFTNWEIIVVSDGEKFIKDNLKFIPLNPCLKFFAYDVNQGKGYALKFGFSKSIGELIVFMDADMELHPSDIKNFVSLQKIYDVDIVIGSKRHPYSKIYYPFYRKFLSLIYQAIIRLCLNLKGVRDSQVGLKLFKREILQKALPRVLIKRYAFDLELLTVASRLGYDKILEAPIKLKYNPNFKINSTKDILRTLKIGWNLLVDTLAIIYRFRILKYYDRK